LVRRCNSSHKISYDFQHLSGLMATLESRSSWSPSNILGASPGIAGCCWPSLCFRTSPCHMTLGLWELMRRDDQCTPPVECEIRLDVCDKLKLHRHTFCWLSFFVFCHLGRHSCVMKQSTECHISGDRQDCSWGESGQSRSWKSRFSGVWMVRASLSLDYVTHRQDKINEFSVASAKPFNLYLFQWCQGRFFDCVMLNTGIHEQLCCSIPRPEKP
jgi:hypothetical protein